MASGKSKRNQKCQVDSIDEDTAEGDIIAEITDVVMADGIIALVDLIMDVLEEADIPLGDLVSELVKLSSQTASASNSTITSPQVSSQPPGHPQPSQDTLSS